MNSDILTVQYFDERSGKGGADDEIEHGLITMFFEQIDNRLFFACRCKDGRQHIFQFAVKLKCVACIRINKRAVFLPAGAIDGFDARDIKGVACLERRQVVDDVFCVIGVHVKAPVAEVDDLMS